MSAEGSRSPARRPASRQQRNSSVVEREVARGPRQTQQLNAADAGTPPSSPRRGKAAAGDAEAGERTVVDIRMHPEHRGFVLGGRAGKMVVRVVGGPDSRVLLDTDEALDGRVLLKQGWKLLASDGVYSEDGMELLKAISVAKRAGENTVLTFEVDAGSAKLFNKRVLLKQQARRKLREALGGLSLAALGTIEEAERQAYLRNLRVQWLLVDASAVLEVEVLLQTKGGQSMQLAKELFTAAKQGDAAALQQLFNHPEFSPELLLQRDGSGNVALHHAANAECAALLAEREPQAKDVVNGQGRLPVHTYVMRQPEDTAAMACLVGGQDWASLHTVWFSGEFAMSMPVEARARILEADRQLLRRDENGISAAMMLQGPVRAGLEARIVPWSDFQAALETEGALEILPALEALGPDGLWPDILAFHCFAEARVWQRGHHTARSATRLVVLGGALGRIIAALETGRGVAVAIRALGQLLHASRGPRCPPFDPREPYRLDLLARLLRLQTQARAALDDKHKSLERRSDPDSRWLVSFPDVTAEDIAEEPSIVASSLSAEDLPERGLRYRGEVPGWLRSDYDLGQVYADLQEVGSIDAFHRGDGAYDMLRLAEARAGGSLAVAEDDCFLAQWFAAWLRGLCQARQGSTLLALRSALGLPAEGPRSWQTQSSLKPKARLFERLSELFAQLTAQLGENQAGVASNEGARDLLRQAAAFVVDMNVFIFVADDVEQLHAVVLSLQRAADAEHITLRRLCKAFTEGADPEDDYGKAYACIPTAEVYAWVELQDSMLVELRFQLSAHVADQFLGELTLDIFHGQYDWPHLLLVIRASLKRLQDEELQQRAQQQDEELRRRQEQEEAEAEERRRIEEEERLKREAELAKQEEARRRANYVKQQKALGVPAADLLAQGYRVEEIRNVASELKNADLTKKAMEAAGFTLQELLYVRVEYPILKLLYDYSINDLRQEGVSAAELFACNMEQAFSRENMRLGGFPDEELREAGYDC